MGYYSFNRPRRDGRLSWLCWLTDSGRFTHRVVARPAISPAQDRESSPGRTGGLTTMLCHQLCKRVRHNSVKSKNIREKLKSMEHYFNSQSLPHYVQIYRAKLTVLFAVTKMIFYPSPSAKGFMETEKSEHCKLCNAASEKCNRSPLICFVTL